MKRHSERGAVLIWALILFVVVTVTSTSLISIFMNDTREVSSLEKRMSLYYASLSGLEYGYGALLAPYGSSTLLEEYIGMPDSKELNDIYDIKDGAKKVASSEVKIYKKTIGSTKWVVVESKGKVVGVGGDYTSFMRINANNITEVIRDGAKLPTSATP